MEPAMLGYNWEMALGTLITIVFAEKNLWHSRYLRLGALNKQSNLSTLVYVNVNCHCYNYKI
jgi:hypothetical protein